MHSTRLTDRLRFALVLLVGTAVSATACGKDFLVENGRASTDSIS
jgi:hypothetical protein